MPRQSVAAVATAALVISIATPAFARSTGGPCNSLQELPSGQVVQTSAVAANAAFEHAARNWIYMPHALGHTSCVQAEAKLTQALQAGNDSAWLTAHNFTLSYTLFHDLKVNGKTVVYREVSAKGRTLSMRYYRIGRPPKS